MRFSRRNLVLLLAALLVGALASASSARGEPAPSPGVASARVTAAPPAGFRLRSKTGGRPNVLLVTIDTLRSDHLGAYGYRLPTSPAIDRLAEEGVVFTDAITPVPTTAPALASVLTGQHVDVHRVHLNATSTIPETVESVAEAFAAAGYDTAGFYGNEAAEGFGRGFKVFEEFPRRLVHGGLGMADDLGVARALEWLAGAKEPWFLWVHMIDPHGPYDSSPPERSAAFAYPDDPALGKELEVSPKNWVFGAIPRYQGLPGLRRVVDYVRRYDGEIVGTDLQIGKLRAWLEEKGKLDHTLLVLTADHGESLTEDAYYFQHGKMLNEASLRVPLILRHADLPAGRKVDAPVSLVDLYPTIAGLVGLPVPAGVAGRDVSSAIGGADFGERLRIAYTVTPDLKVSVLRGRWRLRGRPRHHPRKEGGGVRIDQFPSVQLTDTSHRPEVVVPLREEPEVVGALREELVRTSRRVRSRPAPEPQFTEKQEERLRALGYIE